MAGETATNESVDLDVFGGTHVDFGPDALVYAISGGIRLPFTFRGLDVNSGPPMRYREIQWVGAVIRRQWSMLIPAVPFLLLGPWWMVVYFGNWPVFCISVFVFAAFGLFPLFILLRGRNFLGVVTEHQILLVPMDRQRKQVGRIVGLLKQLCPPETRWNLAGTRLQDANAIDERPLSGRESVYKRYAVIGTLISAYCESQSLVAHQRFRMLGIGLGSTVALISVVWSARSVARSFKRFYRKR